MIILALDQASRTSGYSVFDSNDQSLIAYGKFTFDDPAIENRLVKIRQKVSELIDEYSIDQLAVEDIQLQKTGNTVQVQNVVTYKTLAEVFGVVTELAAERHIPCDVVSSNTWKSACKIGGRTRPEQKRNAQAHVLDRYKINATQDEADSICLGEYVASTKACAW